MNRYPLPEIDLAAFSRNTRKGALSRIKFDDIEELWHVDWHDGPLSGLCVYDGKRHWYEIWNISTDGLRTYLLISLTEKEIEFQAYWHRLYLKYVKNKPQNSWHQYYQLAESGYWTPRITKDNIVGWYTDD